MIGFGGFWGRILHVCVSLDLRGCVAKLGTGTSLQRFLAGTILRLARSLTNGTNHRLLLFTRIKLASHGLPRLEHRHFANGSWFSLTRTWTSNIWARHNLVLTLPRKYDSWTLTLSLLWTWNFARNVNLMRLSPLQYATCS